MSSFKNSKKNIQTLIDSEFIGFINSLNESIKEFYNVAKYNTKETNAFLDLLDQQFESLASLLNSISNPNNNENITKIVEIIIQCKNIDSQLRNNSNLNFNNLSLFFDDAKILFKRMRNKRNESLKVIRHSLTSKKDKSNNSYNKNSITLNNYLLKDNKYLTERKNSEKFDNSKIFSLIKQLKDYDEIIGKFSLKAKNNFINLQKMLINNLTKENVSLDSNKKPYLNSEILDFNNKSLSKNKNNNNNINIFELKSKYENEINKLNFKIKELEKNNENILLISNKAKKFDELNQRIEVELITGNDDNINLLKDFDLEKRVLNLIDTNKNLNLEIKKLKNDINNLDLKNIQLKQDLLGKERDILILQSESEEKKSIESIIKLKKDMQNLYKENNLLKEKLRNINANNININQNANINKNSIDALNIKIEELSKLLTSKMKQIISLEKENINLKTLLSDTTSNSSNANNKINIPNKKITNVNNISKQNQIKLLQENKQYKNSLVKLTKENQELKIQLQNLGMNNNYILTLQQELNQLKKIIDENNVNNNNKDSDYEQKINNLQNILNEKEALINKYERYNNNDKNKLIEEIKNKDKIISELKNKLINNEKQVLSLNQKLKKNNENNNNTPNINNKELELIKNENKNLEYNINQLNQEIAKLTNTNEKNKKELDNLKQAYNELVTQNVLLNKKNSELLQQVNPNPNQNLNLNQVDLSNQIKKKQEEIEGLNTFIQKLTKESEKSREDIENYQSKINSLQKENASIKKQLERLAVEMPKELNALKTQLDDANKKLAEANININNSNNKISLSNTKTKIKDKDKEKSNKTFDDGMQPEKYNNILSKLNQEISDLKNKNKELLFKLEDKEVKSQNSRYKTEDLNMSGYEEEFDLRKMATGARDKNRSEDINIDYPGIQGFKDKLKEYKFRIDNLEEQVKILLSKIKITNSIKPTFVQICQLLGYSSNHIEKMTSSEKEKKKILGV